MGCASSGTTAEALKTVQYPNQWQQTSASPVNALSSEIQFEGLSPWWEQFGDVALNRLVKLALVRNNSLAVAGFKLKQAQLQVGLAKNDQLPNLSGSGSASTNRRFSSGTSSHSLGLGASVSYEVDLWGKLARVTEQKQWEAQASEQDLHSTQLSITGSVVRLYGQIAYLNQRLALAQSSIDYSQRTLSFVQTQYKEGAVSQLEVINAEKAIASQKAAYADLVDQREQARNALAVLFDAPPTQHIAPEPQQLHAQAFPALALGLPADILARRPDLAAAELRLRSTLANVDIARANFYPNFSLTGSINGSSSQLSQVLSDPLGALALNMALPFLNWNANQLSLKVSKVAYQQATSSFRQTLYDALTEVENALSTQKQLAVKAEQLNQQLVLSQQSEHLYEVRYRAGAASLKEWLDAQEDYRQVQASVLANQYAVYGNQITLYLALGGS